MSIDSAILSIEAFQGESLTESLSKIEQDIVGADLIATQEVCSDKAINNDFMNSALSIKNVAGQINVIIHAAGILYSLPSILHKGEIVESVSLGAGNTGKRFDLETNRRVAEYKFIDWKGGPESIRQNGIFKDFYNLAEYETDKEKFLYVVGTKYPLKFLNGGRALTSILSKQPKMLEAIKTSYGEEITVAYHYYNLFKDTVRISDISPFIGREYAPSRMPTT